MSIAAAYMVPHPPMIVPQVGKGSENQVLKTIQAYKAVAAEIAEIRPETIIVTSPQELVGMIVEKAAKMAKMMNIPVLGLVENMSWIACPDCGKKIYPFGESQTAKVALEEGIPLLAQLPIDPAIAKESVPCLKLNRSDVEKALFVIERYHTASMRFVFPSPLLPEMQLMFGEKDSSWKAMFLKSWTAIFLSTGIVCVNYVQR